RMPRHTLIGRMEDINARVNYRGFITSNVAYKRDALTRVGGFDESLRCGEDQDLAWRLRDAGFRIVHDPRPVVLHDPPEVSGSIATYLRKEFWYARHDVAPQLRAVRRASATGGAGSAEAASGFTYALRAAACAAAVGSGLVAPELAILGLALASYQSARGVTRTARAAGGIPSHELAAMIAVDACKRIARGAGTLAGLAELARPTKRALVTSPSALSSALEREVLEPERVSRAVASASRHGAT
ncbi:MAG: galactosyltransferase-related protein, partial [Candidatus Thermoplasmatota archaeon]